MRLLIALISGILFGAGLAISEMVDPARVLGFLDISGQWDPTLAFVMAGALMVTIPGFYLVQKRKQPLLSREFGLPVRQKIDSRLITGAILFGTGWGLAGLCPGPVLVNLIAGMGEVYLFFVSMLAGMLIYRLLPE